LNDYKGQENRMSTINRRVLLRSATAAGVTALLPRTVQAEDFTGVTATEIRIGSTTALSGPASALGVLARCQEAFFNMINDQGGIAGRKIKFIYYDDGFQPPKTVEQTRRLVENDEVALLFSMLGTAPNSAVVNYINQRKVPHLFLSVNGDKWGNYKTYPWTMPFAPSARTESQIYTKYALQQNPKAKFAILYQNDDLGKDYVAGVRDVLGADFDSRAKAVPYQLTDATMDTHLVVLKASEADVLISGTTAKFGAQAIRKLHELQWKVQHFIANGSSSASSVVIPAGAERAVGLISSAYVKDPNDVEWTNDEGVNDYRRFMQKYFPGGDAKDFFNMNAYTAASLLLHVLKQCGGHLSRENIMKQAESMKDVVLPTLLPGIKVNTSPTDHQPLQQLQLQRWDGNGWTRFGDIIEGAGA
jgi:branched-chain amino acid transport system substrate-binding protein